MKQQIRAMMLEDTLNQGERVAAQVPSIDNQVQQAWEKRDPRTLNRVYIVGCGDSYYAGMATRQAFQVWSGLPAESIESLEFRYLGDTLPQGGLVIGVSVSGQVERTLDCLRQAKERGCFTIGITGTASSRIYDVADHVVDMGIRVREPGPVPQTVYYLANLTALYRIAISLGIARGKISREQAESLGVSLLRLLNQIRPLAQRSLDPIMNYVKSHGGPEPWVVIGGGPNWATAHFGVAKLIEASLAIGVFQELEEWAHEQYFLTGPALHTALIGAHGTIWDRVGATAQAIRNVEGHLLAVVPEGTDLGTSGDLMVEYPAGIPEELTPIITKVPLELLAYCLAEHLDRYPFDYDSPTRKRTVERTIYHGGVSAEAVNRRNLASN